MNYGVPHMIPTLGYLQVMEQIPTFPMYFTKTFCTKKIETKIKCIGKVFVKNMGKMGNSINAP
jgi:hypothetical protein